MSLRLLTPINPPTQPPPNPNLSNSTPVLPSSSDLIQSNSSHLSVAIPQPDSLVKSQTDPLSPLPERPSYPSNTPGRRGGRITSSNNQYDRDVGYSTRGGRRGRGRRSWVVRGNPNPIEQNPPIPESVPVPISATVSVSVSVPVPISVSVPPPAIPPNEPKPPVVTSPSKSAPNQNPRRYTNNTNIHSNNPTEKYQVKYRPRENNNENNVIPPSISVPQEKAEFELSLRNIHTNELRFSLLIKLSDVDKVMSLYSNLLQKSY